MFVETSVSKHLGSYITFQNIHSTDSEGTFLMPRRHAHPLAIALTGTLFAVGAWYATTVGPTNPASCWQKLSTTSSNLVTRRIRIDRMQFKDGHTTAIQVTDLSSGESVTAYTIYNDKLSEPTNPRVDELRKGNKYTLTFNVRTEADVTSGCPNKERTYDYVVGINGDSAPSSKAA